MLPEVVVLLLSNERGLSTQPFPTVKEAMGALSTVIVFVTDTLHPWSDVASYATSYKPACGKTVDFGLPIAV
jgi:hypothetical protein